MKPARRRRLGPRTVAVAALGAATVTVIVAAVASVGAAPDAATSEASAPTEARSLDTTPSPPAALPTTTLAIAPAPEAPPAGESGGRRDAGFEFTIGPVDAETRAKMGGTWAPGCPVPVEDLRHVTVTHFGFDGAVHAGEILVAADAAESLRAPFRTIFELRYPIQVLTVTDGEDVPWDESTAFNCRKKVGKSSEWSEHSYGRAIDINPVQNPYVGRSSVVPDGGQAFVDRTRTDAGVLHPGDPVVVAFEMAGWQWGGGWSGVTKDYMHFSTTGH